VKPPSPLAPSPQELKEEGLAFLRQINPRELAFLNPRGGWEEGPRTDRDRLSHTLFFYLRSRGEEEAARFFDRAFSPYLTDDGWPVAQKIGARLSGAPSPFLILYEIILWILGDEACRLNAEASVPEWNADAHGYKKECRLKHELRAEFLRGVLTETEQQKFLRMAADSRREAEAVIDSLAPLVAEEERLAAELESLIGKIGAHSQKEEIYAQIIEKIQPPQGIVTQVSPALFFPCLRLLLDDRLDFRSGIPYMASVVLSIFQDSRSTRTLLRALEGLPLSRTKIRENIIYTLGCLREEGALGSLINVLESPDEIREAEGGAEHAAVLLLEQKEEAIWALGKIGLPAVAALPALARYADHRSARLRTYLAWTLGEVGNAQKEATGGVSADVVIALLTPLVASSGAAKQSLSENKQVFEEAVSALKKIDLPEFVHSLYLYHAGAVSILGLKPAQRGLYELSETLHHLLRTKKRTVMAVNGDSGTGKTYFCQAIAEGFAGIRADEILYLMRDTKKGQKVFNRLLGLKWLKKHIDPAYYEGDSVAVDEDNPEAYFGRFLEEHADKRLIILDGCRDRHYFQRVIDFFYLHGELDVEVNFRTSFSTKRLNLESREIALESVKLHLGFLEEPALEDTSFYQEGLVLLYDLDNSQASRLNQEETRELFGEGRIDSWGELIRVGDFAGERRPAPCTKESLSFREEDFVVGEQGRPESRAHSFSPLERKLKPALNADLTAAPNLLKTIPLGALDPRQMRFYAQDQVAGWGERGGVFVLTLLDNRVFQAAVDGVTDAAILGRTFYLTTPGRGLLGLSFERNEMTEFAATDSPPCRVSSFPPDIIVTASEDGTIRVFDFLEERILGWPSGLGPISALAVDQKGRIWAGDESGRLKQWDVERKKAMTVDAGKGAIRFVRAYPFGKMLAVEDASGENSPPVLRIVDFKGQATQTIPVPEGRTPTGVNAYYDGRIIVCLAERAVEKRNQAGSLLIVSPPEQGCSYLTLAGHPGGTRDCLAMGPKVITCGKEADRSSAVRIWGSELYVRTELSRLFIHQ
jgi:adenylate kinase family enzyme